MLAVVALLAVTCTASAPAAADEAAATPLVVVERRGGLCAARTLCRTVFTITDTRITSAGYVPRRISPKERAALERAIQALDIGYLRAHPFTGGCPTVYDGQESVYRFRGFPHTLASCTNDLRAVKAVRLAERLVASLKHRR